MARHAGEAWRAIHPDKRAEYEKMSADNKVPSVVAPTCPARTHAQTQRNVDHHSQAARACLVTEFGFLSPIPCCAGRRLRQNKTLLHPFVPVQAAYAEAIAAFHAANPQPERERPGATPSRRAQTAFALFLADFKRGYKVRSRLPTGSCCAPPAANVDRHPSSY